MDDLRLLMLREYRALLYSLSYSIPMLSILDSRDKTESNKVLKRLNSYKRIYSYLGYREQFEKIAGSLYTQLKNGTRARELPVGSIEKRLREKLAEIFGGVVEDLRSSGYGREADKIDEFVHKGEFKNAYLSLKDLREMEYRNEKIETLRDGIDETMRKIVSLRNIGSDIDDIVWRIAELLGVNRTNIPTKKMVFVNDESGNSTCLISTYLKRMNIPHKIFSTKNVGDYWITKVSVANSVNPNLRASDLSELIVKSDDIVILEDLNYLVLVNSFSEVYQFLQYLKNKGKSRIIITGNFKMLSEREIARLRGLFDATLSINSTFNICSWAVVGLRERKSEGSLLLSKELVEDFNGKVALIADFGGDKYIHPQRIDFEITDIIHRYIQNGDVVIDCIDLMIDENGLEKIYVWLKGIRDLAILHGNRVYVVENNLIAKEREYIRALLDFDTFYVSKIDMKIIDAMSIKMDIIEKAVEREIQKECAYNMEIIRQKYDKYKKYLGDLKEDVEKLISEESDFSIEFLLSTSPLRKRIEEQAEIIELKSKQFIEMRDEIENKVKIAKEYVDVEDIEFCMKSADEYYQSGDIDNGLDKISVCKSKMDKLMDTVQEEAWKIYGEIRCVDYLLPVYFQNKLNKFENGINNLKEFTRLYQDIKKMLLEKTEAEYSTLRKYSLVSGIPLPNMDSLVHRLKLCDYKKERDKFLGEFEQSKDRVIGLMKNSARNVMDFLNGQGYKVPISKGKIEKNENFEELFGMVERVFNHFSMFISKKIDDLRKKYPEHMEKHERDVEKILVDASINPTDAISRYNLFVEHLEREIGEKEAKMLEISKRLNEYYSLFRKYKIPFEEWYPTKVEDGEVIVSFLGHLFGGLNPEIKVELEHVSVDEDLTSHILLSVKNTGTYEAKNISLEVYGIFKSQEKIESMKEGGEIKLEIIGKIENPNENINVDVFFEGVDGNMINRSFVFDVDVKGYTLSYATGVEHCALCRGKIFKGDEMVVCSECGATYHKKCAERLRKCKICGNVFVF